MAVNTQQHQTAELFNSNKEIIGIFEENAVGAQRFQTLKWIKELLERPKYAPKEEEKLKAISFSQSFISDIQKGDAEYKMNYFNQLVEQILSEFQQKNVKEGNLYVRSLTLKRWKVRKVRLQENEKQLTVFSNDSVKILSLSSYVIKWIGQKKEYQAFSLDSVSSTNHYKQLLFGWTNFDASMIWHDSINKVIQNNNFLKSEILFSSNLAPNAQTSPSLTNPSIKTPENQNKKDNTIQVTQEFEKVEKPNPKPLQSNHLSDTNSSNQNGQNSSKMQINDLKLSQNSNQKPKSISPSANQSPLIQKPVLSSVNGQDSHSNNSNPSQQKQSSDLDRKLNKVDINNSKKEDINISSSSSLSPNSSSTIRISEKKEDSQKKDSSPSNFALSQQNRSQLTQEGQGNKGLSPNKSTQNSFIRSSEKNDDQSKNEQSSNKQLQTSLIIKANEKQEDFNNKKDLSPNKMSQTSQIRVLEYDQSKKEKSPNSSTHTSFIRAQEKLELQSINKQDNQEDVSILQSQNYKEESSTIKSDLNHSQIKENDVLEDDKTPPIIKKFLADYKLDLIEDERQFNTVSVNNGVRLLQDTEDPRRFKIFIAVQGLTVFEVFNCICNVDDYKKWNNNVAETKVLHIVPNQQASIIYQKHKGIGIMYRSRDYVYLRHAFINNQKYYLVDKSIEYDNLPASLSVVRGEIEYVVWSFKGHQNEANKCLLVGEFFFNNSGYSNKEQDASITFSYLNNFSNLPGYLTLKTFQKCMESNMFDLGNIGNIGFQEQDSINQKKSLLASTISQNENQQGKLKS